MHFHYFTYFTYTGHHPWYLLQKRKKQYLKEVLDIEFQKSTSQNFPSLNTLGEYILRVHKKIMLQREMIRAEVNAGEFLQSILTGGGFTR